MTDEYVPLLSPECEAFLSRMEAFGVQSVLVADEVCIHNVDGDRMFTVTKGINARDLQTAWFHGDTMYHRGERGGRAGLQAALRNLISAAPLEPCE